MDKFEGLDEAFETVSEIVPAEVEEPKAKKPPIKKEEKDDVGKDLSLIHISEPTRRS